jgi:hypothetical protein
MSDLKAPTYKKTSPCRSGLYGPTAIILRSDIFKPQSPTNAMSNLKAPTSKFQTDAIA